MSANPPGVAIVYDGECPFCSAYVRLVRLREAAGPIELIDARSDHPLVAELKRRGMDLDQGMAMRIGDELIHGDAVMHRIALMSGPSGRLNRVNAWIFRSPRRARLLYPPLRAMRNLTLRLLGRRRIGPA